MVRISHREILELDAPAAQVLNALDRCRGASRHLASRHDRSRNSSKDLTPGGRLGTNADFTPDR